MLKFCSVQWDEALMTMGLEEKAELTIQPEWAYGRKGLPEHKYPFTFTKHFLSFSNFCFKFLKYIGVILINYTFNVQYTLYIVHEILSMLIYNESKKIVSLILIVFIALSGSLGKTLLV